MYSYVSKERLVGPKTEIERVLDKLVELMHDRYHLETSITLVGSAKSGLVTQNQNGHFDFDYNICFSDIQENGGTSRKLQSLKDKVRAMFYVAANGTFAHCKFKKPVITFEHAGNDYSLDLGILIKNRDGEYCRLIYEKKTGQYSLAEIALLYNVSAKEEYVRLHDGWKEVEKLYLKNKNEQNERDSFHVYLETLDTVYVEKGGSKMSKVSGNDHTQKQMNDYANQKNPNSAAHKAAADNKSNQKNPNNAAYSKGKSNK